MMLTIVKYADRPRRRRTLNVRFLHRSV